MQTKSLNAELDEIGNRVKQLPLQLGEVSALPVFLSSYDEQSFIHMLNSGKNVESALFESRLDELNFPEFKSAIVEKLSSIKRFFMQIRKTVDLNASL